MVHEMSTAMIWTIYECLKVSYSTRLRGIKVELQLLSPFQLMYNWDPCVATPVNICSLSTIELTNSSETTWSRVPRLMCTT